MVSYNCALDIDAAFLAGHHASNGRTRLTLPPDALARGGGPW